MVRFADWVLTLLGEILTEVSRPMRVDPGATYRLLGAHWYAKGLYVKDEKIGAEIQANNLFRVRVGDFIYNRLFAWKGSFAVASSEHDGCFVSNEFPCFELDRSRVDPSFLWLYFSREAAWAEALGLSSGSTPTSRNRLKEEQFLRMAVPLPPLEEQRRIVARIEDLAAKIEEARALRHQAAGEADVLLACALKRLLKPTHGWQTKLISACSVMSTGTTPPSHRNDYYGGGLQWYTPGDLQFRKRLGRSSRTVSDVAMADRRVRTFEPGTLLLVAIGASLGKLGLAHEPCTANQQITGIRFSADILPEYGFWWMRSLYNDLRAAAPQATLPIINQRRIGEFKIAFPPIREQRRISARLDDLQMRVDTLKRLQAETGDELDTLLPSILDKAFRGEL